MPNLWRELDPGPNVPFVINVIVEIPKGSRNKYEYSKAEGVIRLDRVLFSSLHYPGDYGLIPQTHYEDGDPLDVLVMTEHPTFPGCVIQARPIGVFQMLDRGDPDDKILAVPAKDPLFTGHQELNDIPPHFLTEVGHFFEVYKDLEHVRTKGLGWLGAQAAHKRIEHALELYRQKFGGETA